MGKGVAEAIVAIAAILRPNQWYKNLVIFAALFFSGNLLEQDMALAVVKGFAALCLLSSGSYVLNDIMDIERDRNHMNKSKRPVASGALSSATAAVISASCYAIGVLVSLSLGTQFLIIGLMLVGLTLSYIFVFREIAFADIIALSANFIIRAVAGAVIIDVIASPWLVLGTFLLALFLSAPKRKADLVSLGAEAHKYKKVFNTYTVQLLDNIIMMVATALLITYALFTFQSTELHSQLTIASIPIVFYIVFRYYSYTVEPSKPEFQIAKDPELLFLKDKAIVLGIVAWLLIMLVSFYPG